MIYDNNLQTIMDKAILRDNTAQVHPLNRGGSQHNKAEILNWSDWRIRSRWCKSDVAGSHVTVVTISVKTKNSTIKKSMDSPIIDLCTVRTNDEKGED